MAFRPLSDTKLQKFEVINDIMLLFLIGMCYFFTDGYSPEEHIITGYIFNTVLLLMLGVNMVSVMSIGFREAGK